MHPKLITSRVKNRRNACWLAQILNRKCTTDVVQSAWKMMLQECYTRFLKFQNLLTDVVSTVANTTMLQATLFASRHISVASIIRLYPLSSGETCNLLSAMTPISWMNTYFPLFIRQDNVWIKTKVNTKCWDSNILCGQLINEFISSIPKAHNQSLLTYWGMWPLLLTWINLIPSWISVTLWNRE